MKRVFRNGRYANVTATLALIVALSGTSYAAVKISGRQITNNSITSEKIKNGSLRPADFKAGRLVDARVRNGTPVDVAPGTDGSATVSCRTGERALSGDQLAGYVFGQVISAPISGTDGVPTGWAVQARNLTSSPQRLFVYVICARA